MIASIRLFFLTTLCAFALHAQQHLLTVDDLIALAMQNSPDLNISRADFNASKQQTRIAVSDYLPRVDLSGSAGAAGIESNSLQAENEQENGELLTGTLSASQLIYDFGKTGGNIRRYSYESNASFSGLQQAISNKIFDVKRGYYNVLKNMSLIKVNKENVALNEKQLVRAERYFDAGIRTKIDVTDARVNLIEAKLKLQDSQYELVRARIVLERIVGIKPYGGDYTLYGLTFDSTRLYQTLPDIDQPLEGLEKDAYRMRQELKRSAFLLDSASAAVTSARGDYFPKIYLAGSYTLNETDEQLELYFPKQQWGAGVMLDWNLFEGMRTDASVMRQRYEVMRRSAAFNDTRLQIRQEVADSHTLTLKSRDSVKLSESLAEAAKEKFTQAQKRYEYGLSDYIELQQARQGYIDALSSLYIKYYDFYIALANRDRAVGY